MEWFSKLFEVDKLPFKVVFLTTVISGLVAFSPLTWLSSLQLDGFKNEYGVFIGITFLASSGLTLTNIVIYVFRLIRGEYQKMQWKAGLTHKLETLDHSEQAILREFYIQGKYTIEIPVNNPSVVGLMNKGIVVLAGKYGEHSLSGMLFPCAIIEDARNRLTNKILGLPDGTPSEEDMNRIKESRPAFTRDIERRDWLRDFRLH